MQESPSSSRGTRVLTSHQQSDHDVRYFVVRKGCAVAVRLTHEDIDHIWFVVLGELQHSPPRQKMGSTDVTHAFLPRLDNVDIEISHLFLCAITFAVALQR